MAGQRPSSPRIDPAVDIMRRIERLERTEAHPDSTLGITTADIGDVEPTDSIAHGAGWGERVTATIFSITVDPDVPLGVDLT